MEYPQAVAIIDKYYHRVPELWHEPLAEMLTQALTSAGSPCKGKSPNALWSGSRMCAFSRGLFGDLLALRVPVNTASFPVRFGSHDAGHGMREAVINGGTRLFAIA